MSVLRKSPQVMAMMTIVILGLVYVVYSEMQRGDHQATYDDAVAAMEQGECTRAIELFEQLQEDGIFRDTNNYENAELNIPLCEAYLELETSDDTQLIDYIEFHDDLLDHELTGVVGDTIRDIIATNSAEAIANDDICGRSIFTNETLIDEIAAENLIPEPDTTIPDLYIACANFYTVEDDLDEAVDTLLHFNTIFPGNRAAIDELLAKSLIDAGEAAEDPQDKAEFYALFVTQFPDDDRTSEISQELADIRFATAREADAPEITQPDPTDGEVGELILQNPRRNPVEFLAQSEAGIHVVVLPACTLDVGCACDTGPQATITLAPDDYDISVYIDGNALVGNWDVAAAYDVCFERQR